MLVYLLYGYALSHSAHSTTQTYRAAHTSIYPKSHTREWTNISLLCICITSERQTERNGMVHSHSVRHFLFGVPCVCSVLYIWCFHVLCCLSARICWHICLPHFYGIFQIIIIWLLLLLVLAYRIRSLKATHSHTHSLAPICIIIRFDVFLAFCSYILNTCIYATQPIYLQAFHLMVFFFSLAFDIECDVFTDFNSHFRNGLNLN